MRIGGVAVNGPKTNLVVIPRTEGDLVFKYKAVQNDDEFRLLCPPPKAGRKTIVGKGTVDDVEAPGYVSALEAWRRKHAAWSFLKTIEPSNIEWATVNMTDPETYLNWEKEFRDAGFSENELQVIYNGFVETTILTQKLLDEARARFLASQEPEVAQP